MTEITEKQIDHLAELSALELDAKEKQKMQNELQNILEFASKVKNLEINMDLADDRFVSLAELRDDIAKSGLSNEEALSNAPKKENGCYVVSKVVD